MVYTYVSTIIKSSGTTYLVKAAFLYITFCDDHFSHHSLSQRVRTSGNQDQDYEHKLNKSS